MRALFALLLPIVTVNAGLLGKDLEPQFFDINVDRDHPEKLYKAFEDFIVKYKRHYKDDIEKKFRMNNFVKTWNKVEELNEKSKKEGYDTKFGINKFADLSSAEFSGTLSHFTPPNITDIPPFKMNSFFRGINESKTRKKRRATQYPDSFDLRDAKINGRYVVGPIKNQGKCACCWGFAVTAVMETVNAVNSGSFTSLSDQELCDCATDGTPGCKGGALDMGIRYVAKYGQSGDDEYPYTETRAQSSRKCKLKSTRRVIPARAMQFVSINSRRAESEIIHVLVNWKIPVAVYFKCGDQFKNYDQGVIVTDDCRRATEWHAGAIVGYDSIEDSRGRTHDYWIIKNSWNDDWGEDGYVKVKRNIDWCGIEDSPVTGDMSSHNEY